MRVVGSMPSSDEVEKVVAQIEERMEDLLDERIEFMNRCKPIKKEIKNIIEAAGKCGFDKPALKTKIKQRELIRKAERAAADLEADERDFFEFLTEKLGDFGSLPLGKAALDRVRAAAG